MPLNEIKQSVQQLKADYEAMSIESSFREVLRVQYGKQVLNKLELIFNQTKKDEALVEFLQVYLAENWALVHNTALGYTSLPEDKITLLLCDIAEHIAAQKGLTSAEVLMPGLAYESIRDGYGDLTGDIKPVLRTHIIGDGCQYMLPVKLITELNLSPTPAQLANPYYDYERHTDEQAYVRPEEYKRLVAHSQLTQAVADAKQAYELLAGDTSNLLGQLTQLCRQLGINMVGNLGEEENAGSGSYPAIIAFMEYYHSLDAAQKDTIPPTIKQEIEKLYTLVTDKTKNINATENLETCIATRRASLIGAMSDHDEALSQISLSASKRASLTLESRTKFESAKHELIEALGSDAYTEGHDSLAMNMSLLEKLNMPLRITSLGDLSILQELMPDEIKSVCANPNLRQTIITQLRAIENLVVFSIETSPDKLEAFLIAMKGDIVQAWLHSFRDLSALLISLDVEKTRIMVDVLLRDTLISMMQAQDGLSVFLQELSPEQRSVLSDSIKINDKSVMLAAVQQDYWAFQYATEVLKADRDFVLAAVRQNGVSLHYAPEAFQTDKDFVLAAVRQNGVSLHYASRAFQADRDFVLAAVKQNGVALQYAAEDFKADREVVLAAVKQNGRVLEFASRAFQADRDFMLAAVKQNGLALEYASDEFKADREVVLAAVKQDGRVLEFASKELKKDKEVVLAAVRQNGLAFEYASDEFKADREVVLAAVKQDGFALQYASEELMNDWSLKTAATLPFFALALEHPEASKAITLGLATSAIVMYSGLKFK